MRKSIEIVVQGLRLRGVVHAPLAGSRGAAELNEVGVVILHPGFLPRSGQGDFAVALAEAIAEEGVPAVRIDMPGLGDSEGDLPEDSFAFIDITQEGGFAEVAWECVERIQEQLHWRKVIIGGHCGGAITGFFALADRKRNGVAGMFALETMFHMVRSAAPVQTAEAPMGGSSWRLRREVFRQEMRAALLNSKFGGSLQKLAQRSREMLKGKRPVPAANPGAAKGGGNGRPIPKQLPVESNFKLLKSVEQVIKSDLPLLFVTADDPTKPAECDYVEYLLSRCAGQARHERLFGTDHGFLSGGGKDRVIACVTKWIGAEFRQGVVA
jgi:pimeloyl-ACP methyl ester carboxylesterase